MALLAEVIVEEWLNRQGYFTMRGIKLGVDEIDLLAIRLRDGALECRHLEVQASMRPVSYISRVPKAVQKSGRAPNSAKRSDDELRIGVREWVDNKFNKQKKLDLMRQLAPGPWTRELVIHRVKSAEEVTMINKLDVRILHLGMIVSELRATSTPEPILIASAGGADFMDLVLMADHSTRIDSLTDALAAAVYSP